MSYTLEFPIQYIPNPIKSSAIGNGSLYIGQVDGNPAFNPADRIQVYVARQGLSDLPISQPIDINAGGVPVYNGSPVTLKVGSSYSTAVLNNLGSQVYYSPKSGEEIDAFAEIDDELSLRVKTIGSWNAIGSTAVDGAGQLFYLAQHTYSGLGGGPMMSFSGSVTDDGGIQKIH